MRTFRSVLLAIAMTLLSACPQAPSSPPLPDAADASSAGDVTRACANLALRSCPEGAVGANCHTVLEHAAHGGADGGSITPIDLGCLARAASPEEIRRCGFVRCTP